MQIIVNKKNIYLILNILFSKYEYVMEDNIYPKEAVLKDVEEFFYRSNKSLFCYIEYERYFYLSQIKSQNFISGDIFLRKLKLKKLC